MNFTHRVVQFEKITKQIANYKAKIAELEPKRQALAEDIGFYLGINNKVQTPAQKLDNNAVRKAVRGYRKAGAKSTQQAVLEALDKKAPKARSVIADELGILAHNVTSHLMNLSKKGLVKKHGHIKNASWTRV